MQPLAYIYVAFKGIANKIILNAYNMNYNKKSHLLNVLFIYMVKHGACSWDFVRCVMTHRNLE